MKIAVIYLWQGERHQFLTTFTDEVRADAVVAAFHAAGWRAWTEVL